MYQEVSEMKKLNKLFAVLLVFIMALTVTGCGKKDENYSLVGVWEYADKENGISAVYDLNDKGTGTYTMTVGENTVVYELKYEVQNNHLLVTFVNNDIFSEDDVFDSEFRFKDANSFIVKDSTGAELEFVKK